MAKNQKKEDKKPKSNFLRRIQETQEIAEKVIFSNYILEDELAELFMNYCWNKLKRIEIGTTKIYGVISRFIHKRNRTQLIPYEGLSRESTLFLKDNVPILVRNIGDEDRNRIKCSVQVIRGTIDIEKLIVQITETLNKQVPEKDINRFDIYHVYGSFRSDEDSPRTVSNVGRAELEKEIGDSKRIIGFTLDDIHPDYQPEEKLINTLALNSELKDFVNEVIHWKNSKSWYKLRRIPWKRGSLLYGSPGTGKSSLVKAVAEYLKIPLYVFDLSTMDNQEFSQEWRRLRNNAPCIALLEDIDRVFKKDVNIIKNHFNKQSLSFDRLLNTIDGVESSDGIYLFVTTNNIKNVDPALGGISEKNNTMSTRPGRIDRIVEIKILDKECRTKIAERILEGLSKKEIINIIEDGDGDTAAQFQERCTRTALQNYWKEKAWT